MGELNCGCSETVNEPARKSCVEERRERVEHRPVAGDHASRKQKAINAKQDHKFGCNSRERVTKERCRFIGKGTP
jgi:hypothetical protein